MPFLPRRLRRDDPVRPAADPLAGATPADRAILEQALPFTMTGVARMQALIDAVRHVVERGLPGALAECGVWRGGSVLAMLLTLRELGAWDRDVFLYDTFEGMTAPTEHDVSEHDPPALDTWRAAQAQGERGWPEMFAAEVFSESGVRDTVTRAGYPAERIHFVKGPVEETLPGTLPGPLALLRLDTDWYESTRHELAHLYPLLVPGGVLIIDDYGHWQGAARAVDEYFAAHPPRPLLQRIDYTGRLAVRA
jgi:hypothetical protein